MNRDAAPARDVAADVVAGYRVTAFGETHEKAAFAFDQNALFGIFLLAFGQLLNFGKHG